MSGISLRTMRALTDTKIRQAKPTDKPFQLQDGGGLYLEVRPTGRKIWRYRYWMPDGKDGRMTLGDYPAVSLQDARRKREDAREVVKTGRNPVVAQKVARLSESATGAATFEAVMREFVAKKSAAWSERYRVEFVRILEANILPDLGKVPISDIKPAALLGVLRKMEERGAATYATIARSRCSAVFRYAVQTLRCESDPAALIAGAIIRPTRETARPMPREVLAELLNKLGAYGGHRTTVIAMHIIMLTFVRTIELRRAEWQDFDLGASVWSIPADKMKMARPHIVPLASQAVDLLRELHTITGNGRLLFPHSRRPSEQMAQDTLNSSFRFMGMGQWSAHDFRATASTHLHELGYPSEHIELQLAHSDSNSIRGVYNHARYLPERAEMMQAWADWIYSIRRSEAKQAG